jgi:hypothetical protein|tara:strand:- start:3225 stop:4709 length:1485 start_codon:yes stop_codon:yes gene_type:complete
MPTVLQHRRGTTSQNNSFTGAIGEITYDTTLDTLRVHDGSTAGGFTSVSLGATQTLTNKTLTSPVINTGTFGTSILPTSADGTTLGSASKEFSDLFLADAGTIQFGNDQDVTLTHVADTGLLLNSTMKLQFNDASQYIQGASATVLDIAATDEIELTATLIDVVGNLAGSGTGTFGGILKTDDTTAATSTTDGSLQTDGGLSVAGDAVIGDDLLLLSDAAILKFGADSDINITHVADTGLTTNGDFTVGDDLILGSDASVIKFGADSDVTITHVADSGLTISVPATADNSTPLVTLAAGDNDIAADDVLGQIDFKAPAEGAGTDALLAAGTIKVVSEGNFAADNNAASMIFATGKSAAAGTDGGLLTMTSTGKLVLKDLATADGSSATITLQSGDTDIAANDELGAIFFQAPDEGAGTDAITVAAAIVAMSEGDFSASNNATKISFRAGNSETAVEKAKIVGSTGKFHATPDSILLIKNSGGTTLKTVNGHAAI